MIHVLIVDDDLTARTAVRDVAPADWILLEAPDGLTGIDMVRQHQRELRLVVLDMHLPDVDERTICLRICAICPDLPILPFTGYADTVPAMHELGCLPPVFKPTRPEDLARALQTALTQPMPPCTTTALVSLAQAQSAQIERLVREQRTTLHVAVFADSALKRAGLVTILSLIAQTFAAAHLPALELLLARMPWTALVADARAQREVSRIAYTHRVPLILIAENPTEALAVDTADVACVLREHDPALAAHLVAALTALAIGEQPVAAPLPVEPAQEHRRIVPPRVVQIFADTALCPRELDVLWLDYQGLSVKQIARTLTIVPVTVESHWKRIRKKIGGTREEIQAWARERLRGIAGGGDEERSIT